MVAVHSKVADIHPLLFRSHAEHGEVLLYARDLADITRLQRLLAAAEYFSEASATQLQKSSDSNFYAVIVCQREAAPQDQIDLSVWGSARVIIVSDICCEKSVVASLNEGAHYFFDAQDSDRVLAARLQSALRQHGKAARQPLVLGDIRFDIQKRTVSRAGIKIDLSPKEFDFALYLFSSRDRIVGNHELMTSVWSLPTDMDTRRIDTAACRVRKKLNLFSGEGWELKRIRRVGYRLEQMKRVPADIAGSEFIAKEKADQKPDHKAKQLPAIESVTGRMRGNILA